jgi:hypothetical protein
VSAADLWADCGADAPRVRLTGEVLRLVESQEQVATNQLVDTLAEQALLEELLETTKPRPAAGTERLHYLLATPFRYPPLRYGSRFGARHEPSLFYASRNLGAVLAECAYYRCVFWQGISEPPPAPMTTQHTLFGVGIRVTRGLQLQAPPFDRHRATLTDPADYRATQRLGSALREQAIEAIEYESARDPAHGLNVALYTPAALADARPRFVQEWLCETDAERVRYYSREGGELREFRLDQFVVDGVLPTPAT